MGVTVHQGKPGDTNRGKSLPNMQGNSGDITGVIVYQLLKVTQGIETGETYMYSSPTIKCNLG